MKITEIEALIVDIPFKTPFKASWHPGFEEKFLKVTVIKIHTDEGLTRVSSAEACFGWGEAQLATIHSLIGPRLIGTDSFATEELIKIVRDGANGGCQPWLVEDALWDIVGKAAGLPLYKLWGGGRYASWGES